MHKGYCRLHVRTAIGFDFYEKGEVEYRDNTYYINCASYPEDIVLSCVQLMRPSSVEPEEPATEDKAHGAFRRALAALYEAEGETK